MTSGLSYCYMNWYDYVTGWEGVWNRWWRNLGEERAPPPDPPVFSEPTAKSPHHCVWGSRCSLPGRGSNYFGHGLTLTSRWRRMSAPWSIVCSPGSSMGRTRDCSPGCSQPSSTRGTGRQRTRPTCSSPTSSSSWHQLLECWLGSAPPVRPAGPSTGDRTSGESWRKWTPWSPTSTPSARTTATPRTSEGWQQARDLRPQPSPVSRGNHSM